METLDRNSQMGQGLEQDPEELTILQAPMPQRKRSKRAPRGRGTRSARVRSASRVDIPAVRDGFFRDMVRGLQHNTIAEFPSLPTGVTYLPIPVAGFVTLLFVIERMWLGDAPPDSFTFRDQPQTE